MNMTQPQMYMALYALTRREKLDASYYAAFYLLSSDEELFEKARAHVSIDGIGFEALKRSCREMDERQRQLLSVAHNLFSWNSRCMVTPFDLSRLGYPLLDYVCDALYIASGVFDVQIHENAAGEPELVLDKSRYKQNRLLHNWLCEPAEWMGEPEENDMEIG